MNRLRALLLYPAHMMRHYVRYLSDVKDLTMEGSVEPRRWIGCAEGFWVDAAGSTGDLLLTLVGAPPFTGACALPESPAILNVGERTLKLAVDVPLAAFDALASDALTLVPSALQRGDELVVLPGPRLHFPAPRVTRPRRDTELCLADLPTLQPGTELHGVVWAQRLGDQPAKRAAHVASAALPVAGLWIRVV